MLKMTIDNEEVVSDKDITINEEMLSASSTILNNVYPKEWEEDKDYTSKFYYPQDYSKALIQRSYVTQEAEAGTTIQVNGSVTLTDVDTTKNSRVLRLLGQTSQTGTPTPSSPIPVNVVSGDNEINVVGKNLFKPYEHTDNNGLTLEVVNGNAHLFGTATSNSTFRIMNNVVLNGTYTWSLEGNISLWAWNTTTNSADIILNQNNNQVTKTYNGNNSIIMAFTTTTGTTYDITFKPMLEKGSSATNYEQYIGNTYNIDLPVENLLPTEVSAWAQGSISSTGDVSSTTRIRTIDYYPIKNDTNYYISIQNTNYCYLNIYLYDSNKQFIEQYYTYDTSINGTTGKVINIPSTFVQNVAYMRVIIRRSDNTSTITASEISTIKPQIELGNKQNAFTPYGTTPIELCKIGNYQDYIYKDSDKWYLHKEIGEVVLNGSEDIIRIEAQNNTYRYVVGINTSNIMKINDAVTIGPIVSNKLIATSRTGTFTQTQGICYGMESTTTYKDFVIYCDVTKNMTGPEFITWLSNNNITVYYVLATPTNTEITYTELLNQLNALSSQ